MRRLRDRVAVVTGAASGIGRATSVELARKGCDVAVSDIDEKGLRETARMVEAQGRKASIHKVNVSDKKQMEAFPETVASKHGHVHIVVNNAGVSVTAPLEHHSIEDFEWIVGINFWGVVYGCKFFLPYLMREEEGHIVNLSSMFGLIGLPTQASYCATKFAVRGFSESIWAELKEHNIGVTSVHPGGINTNIVKSSRVVDVEEAGIKAKAVRMFEKSAMPPEEAARQIVRAIEKNQMRLLITRESKVTDALKRVLPAGTNEILLRYRKRFLPI